MATLELTQEEAKFIKYLQKLGGRTGQIPLRRFLKYSRILFEKTKESLVEKKIVALGKGKGGTVQLLSLPSESILIDDPKSLIDLNLEIIGEENDAEILFPLPSEDSWQLQAMTILEQMPKKTLLELCGQELINLLNSNLNEKRHKKRKANRREMTLALLQIYNRDLLFHDDTKEIARRELAKLYGIDKPQRLVSGKREALKFVKACNLPEEMAGEIRESDREPYIVIKGRENNYRPLQPFQSEVVEESLKIFSNNDNINRALVSLPTGAGKTRTAVEITHVWMNNLLQMHRQNDCNLIIWIAQSDELCEQAFNQFREVWENNPQVLKTKIVRLWGGFWKEAHEDLYETISTGHIPAILICTIQTIHNLIIKAHTIEEKSLAQSIKDECDFIIVDEAHHAAAKTYKEVLQTIIDHRSFEHSLGVNLLGLTATPYRNTKENAISELRLIFQNIIIPKKSIQVDEQNSPVQALKLKLQEMGILALEKIEIQDTGVTLKVTRHLDEKVKTKKYDEMYNELLEESSSRHDRRKFIVERILKILTESSEHSVIYFGPSVNDAKIICSMLMMEGTNASFVGDKISAETRESIIADFREGKTRIITNCRILTAGFDAPKITHVILGWPTFSPISFHQMIGRGLRGPKFGGTKECNVVIFSDDIEGVPDLHAAHENYIKEWDLKKSG